MTVVPWLQRGVVGACALVAACGGDGGPDGYGPDHRADFVEDCTTDVATSETCGCLYDRMADSVPFSRFVELDKARRDDAGVRLPADIAGLAAGCAADNADAGSDDEG